MRHPHVQIEACQHRDARSAEVGFALESRNPFSTWKGVTTPAVDIGKGFDEPETAPPWKGVL